MLESSSQGGIVKMDKGKILAGRKAIEDYGKAHNELHSVSWTPSVPDAHTPLLEKMLTALKGLGFNSLDEFYEANKEANSEALLTWAENEGNCDYCVGRQRVCVPTCYDKVSIPLSKTDAPTPTGKKDMIKEILPRNRDVRLQAISLWGDYYRGKMATASVGDTFPIFPGCSIFRRVKAKPEIDFLWR